MEGLIVISGVVNGGGCDNGVVGVVMAVPELVSFSLVYEDAFDFRPTNDFIKFSKRFRLEGCWFVVGPPALPLPLSDI